MNSILLFIYMGMIVSTTAVFKEYCTSGLCDYQGGDGLHSGCRDNILHNGKLQEQCGEDAYMIHMDEFHKKLIVDIHNEQRNSVAGGDLIPDGIKSGCRIGAVVWSEELTLTAELHVKSCIFAHDKCRSTLNYPLSGQNIGITTYSQNKKLNTTMNIVKFMTAWFAEYKDVPQSLIDTYKKIPGPMTGHFLTTVNERNNRVGCSGVNFRSNSTYLSIMVTCNYPTTNINGGTIYNSCKKPGLKCTSGRDKKYTKLCSTKEEYDMDGLLDFMPYDKSDGGGDDEADDNNHGDGDNGNYDDDENNSSYSALRTWSVTNDTWQYYFVFYTFTFVLATIAT